MHLSAVDRAMKIGTNQEPCQDHRRLSRLHNAISRVLCWPCNIAFAVAAVALDWRPLGLGFPWVQIALLWWVTTTGVFGFRYKHPNWRQEQAEVLHGPAISTPTDSLIPKRCWNPWELPKITKKTAIIMGARFGVLISLFMTLFSVLLLGLSDILAGVLLNRWTHISNAVLSSACAGFAFGFLMWFFGGRGYREWTDSTGQFSVEAKFVKAEEEIVWLNRSQDGEGITIPYAKMSNSDRDYVASKTKKRR